MKKFFAILLVLTMVLSLGSVALAEPVTTTTITAPENGHTYNIYQIFVGDLAADGKTLSNVKYGANAYEGNIGNAVAEADLAKIAGLSVLSNKEILAELKNYVDLDSKAFETVSNDSVGVPTGYYLIEDCGPVEAGSELSLYIVKVVGPVDINPKVGQTTTVKKVDDTNDSNTNEDEPDWQDSADYDIGDKVPFLLKATITMEYDGYSQYYFAFHDKQSAGLTFNRDSVVVKVDGEVIDAGYEIVYNEDAAQEDGCTFEIVFKDLKTIDLVHAGSVITVEYTSTLNDDANIGAEGNINTMYGEYSYNPNWEPEGDDDADDDDDDDADDDDDDDDDTPPTEETPDDTVVVFTYDVDVNKVDDAGDPLEGASFELFKWEVVKEATEDEEAVYDWVSKGVVSGEKSTEFVWSGVDDGEYKLVETVTPDGYNTMDDKLFTITAEHKVIWDGEGTALLTLNKDAEAFEGDVVTGIVEEDIVNKSGTVLPTTGGIGTTIFYVVGALLVVAAAVLFVSKKRMSAEG